MVIYLKSIRTLCRFIASALVLTLSLAAHAQNLGIQNNQVTISVPGTAFSQIATLSNTGTVSTVSGVPTTGTLTTPTFSFTLQQTGIVNETGTYAVGIVIDENGSDRRLEVFIPGVVFNFTGGVLAGSLTAPSVNRYMVEMPAERQLRQLLLPVEVQLHSMEAL